MVLIIIMWVYLEARGSSKKKTVARQILKIFKVAPQIFVTILDWKFESLEIVTVNTLG